MNTFAYDKINALVIEQLEKGNIPWRKGWKDSGIPMNYTTKKAYRGFNVFWLSLFGYKSNYWITFNQCKQIGASVNKGAKSTPISFFDYVPSRYLFTIDEKTGEKKPKLIPMLKIFHVFNITQTNIPLPAEQEYKHDPIKEADDLIRNYANNKDMFVRHNGNRACYIPAKDEINMPGYSAFPVKEEYYSTLFHELVHSTGAKDRLNREGVTNVKYFGSHEYSKEELVAEMGACYLSSMVGIEQKTLTNSVAYIQNWLQALKNDKTLLVSAGGKAQKGVDYIINYGKPETT